MNNNFVGLTCRIFKLAYKLNNENIEVLYEYARTSLHGAAIGSWQETQDIFD